MIREIDGILMKIMPFALGWYAPFTRVLYWNRFGHIESYLSRIEDWRDILTYWWLDPEMDKAVKEAKKDKSIQLEVGETEAMYWPEYNEKHGRSYTID
jgi:microcin C transport system substrate-binding protein